MPQSSPSPIHYGFLVMPGFSLIAYAAAIDTLRLANRVDGRKLFTWETLTPDGNPVITSSGLSVSSDKDRDNINQPFSGKVLFVCGGVRIRHTWTPEIGGWLQRLAKDGVALGSLCTGTHILAQSGLLDGYRCTIHWERMASTREQFPNLKLTDNIYEIDRDRYTCAGGTTPIDMMHHLIAMAHGRNLAATITEEFLVDHVRSMVERQRIPLRQQIGTSQPKLTEVVMLMGANIEEPLTPDALAGLTGISRRQLERLFRAHLDCTPTQYYLRLRLNNARRLILQTEKSIVDISIACGFSSAPHFSKCYHDHFGLPPRDERRLLLNASKSLRSPATAGIGKT